MDFNGIFHEINHIDLEVPEVDLHPADIFHRDTSRNGMRVGKKHWFAEDFFPKTVDLKDFSSAYLLSDQAHSPFRAMG
jgi:hypothetical protein